MMTPAELGDIGERIFGATFHRRLAQALGVDFRTFRRWMIARAPIPDGAAADARRLLEIATAPRQTGRTAAPADGTNRPVGRHKPAGN
jgi:hypothetical protein